MERNTKKLIVIFAPILLIVALISFFIYQYLHSATVIIQVAPINAHITLNGKEVGNGLLKTSPRDDAEVVISAPGFKSKTFTINLQRGYTSNLIAYLVPEDNNWEYYEKSDHRDSLSILLSNNGYEILNLYQSSDNITTDQDSSANTLIEKLSIKSITPITFSICGQPATRSNCDSIAIDYEYSSECDDELCLAISGRKSKLDTETLNIIRSKLAESGYNLDNYKYFYTQSDR